MQVSENKQNKLNLLLLAAFEIGIYIEYPIYIVREAVSQFGNNIYTGLGADKVYWILCKKTNTCFTLLINNNTICGPYFNTPPINIFISSENTIVKKVPLLILENTNFMDLIKIENDELVFK
jgi:hypothetical protein